MGRERQQLLGGLPAPLSSFVGRSGDLDELQSLVGRERLVTLTGPGGVGKTRLAVEVARRASDEGMPACFVDLTATTDFAGVATTIEQAVGAHEDAADRTPEARLATIVRHLGPAELLIVVDNCEHVLSASVTAIAAILAQCRGVRVLATSREALDVAGEYRRQVQPLSLGRDAAGEPEAVRLFARRAGERRADAIADDAGRRAAHRICEMVDGLPLAIELAAARVGVYSVPEIADRLAERLGFLGVGPRTAAARHQTMAAAVDWSYQLLNRHEQRLLSRLAVFPASFTMEAAAGVCAGGDLDQDGVMEGLARLVERSLVQRFEPSPGLSRFRILEVVRTFVWSALVQADPPPDHVVRTTAVLRRDGDSWQVGRSDHVFHLTDAKGLRYLAILVTRPAQPIRATELLEAEAGITVVDGAGPGELIDAQAQAAYRRRVRDLQADIDEARAWNDLGRAERAEEELDALIEELRRSEGLGGRRRLAPGAAERARMSVSKAIRTTMARIADHDELLGGHLERSIRLGTACTYAPLAGDELDWRT